MDPRGKLSFPKQKEAHGTLFDPVLNHGRKNPDTVPTSQHKQFFQTVCFGPFISPGVHMDHVFDVNIKILPGEEVCSQALRSRSLELEACGACCSNSLQRAFYLLSSQAQKALWHPSNLCFFRGLSVINSLPDRILAGSYNGMYFEGSHLMTRKVGSVFPGGCRYHTFINS